MRGLPAMLPLFVAAATAAAQPAPQYINYQGRLVDGTNLVNGPVSLHLRLYTNAVTTAGEALLYEDSNTVAVVDGLYSTLLGDDRTAGVFTELRQALVAGPVYVEAVINGTALAPREQLVSVGYALLPGPRGIGTVETGLWAVVGGGITNTASGRGATVPGGTRNVAAGTNSFAAGQGARAVHHNTFVWADAQTNDFSSTTNNQFAVRAKNGVWLASDAGTARVVKIGERYRDNAIIAWAKVQANGSIWQTNAAFGVSSVERKPDGWYDIVIDDSTVAGGQGGYLIAVACPEIDAPPTGLDQMRFIAIDQCDVRNFRVYVNNGNGAVVSNDFTFIVTGR